MHLWVLNSYYTLHKDTIKVHSLDCTTFHGIQFNNSVCRSSFTAGLEVTRSYLLKLQWTASSHTTKLNIFVWTQKSMKTYKSNQYCSIRNFLLKISQRWKWIIACSKTRVVKKNRLNRVFLPLKTARTESFMCWKRPLLSRHDWLRCAMTLERFFLDSAQREM